MLKYYKTPWPHFTGSLPDEFYNHVKSMWDEDDSKKKWNKCKNRSNIIVEDDKINTILNDISLGILSRSQEVFEQFYPKLDYEKLTECFIFLNSGRYLPACLIIHIGLNDVS